MKKNSKKEILMSEVFKDPELAKKIATSKVSLSTQLSKKILHYRTVNILSRKQGIRIDNPLEQYIHLRKTLHVDRLLNEIELEYKMCIFLCDKVLELPTK